MLRGAADGRGVLYDFEGKLIFREAERMYGRRGFLVSFEGSGDRAGASGAQQWLLYYTNQRIVGLRDPTAPEVEDIGSLRPFERQEYGSRGPQLLEYFSLELPEVARAERRRNDVRIHLAKGAGIRTMTFEPLGAAARFFSRLVDEKGRE